MFVFVGQSGAGKSSTIKAELRQAPPAGVRLIVDPDDEYTGLGLRCSSLVDIVQRASAAEQGSYIFVPSPDRDIGIKQFSMLCLLAWRLLLRGRAVVFVVDELADFTSANAAPFAWRRLVKRGRKKGVTIYAASTRPADIDKSIWGNASLIRTGPLGYSEDRREVAGALGVSVDELQQLALLSYVQLDKTAAPGLQLSRGRLIF